MNVLELMQAATGELGIPQPAAFNSDTQILNLLYAVSRELRNVRVFPQQKRSHSFNTADGVSTYALPVDYFSPVLETHYDQSRSWMLNGPLSDADFNWRLYGNGTTSSTFSYRIFGPNIAQYSSAKMMELDPTPSSVNTISYDYITKSMFYPSGWTPGTTVYETITADTHVSMFDDDIMIMGLKYHYREAKGQDYQAFQQKYTRMIERAQARFVGSYRGSFQKSASTRRYRPEDGDGSWNL